ncbi:unnamed protein product [Orchesella dallaii]|uniref:Tudor domain-containing protein n=1 Tax=Orchesella dallaii TaxID=48710 RepID=A0ABP1PVX8_9HEXA
MERGSIENHYQGQGKITLRGEAKLFSSNDKNIMSDIEKVSVIVEPILSEDCVDQAPAGNLDKGGMKIASFDDKSIDGDICDELFGGGCESGSESSAESQICLKLIKGDKPAFVSNKKSDPAIQNKASVPKEITPSNEVGSTMETGLKGGYNGDDSDPKQKLNEVIPTFHGTWDFSLKTPGRTTATKSVKVEGTFYKLFMECSHELILDYCGCTNNKFAVCRLCQKMYCSKKCFLRTVDDTTKPKLAQKRDDEKSKSAQKILPQNGDKVVNIEPKCDRVKKTTQTSDTPKIDINVQPDLKNHHIPTTPSQEPCPRVSSITEIHGTQERKPQQQNVRRPMFIDLSMKGNGCTSLKSFKDQISSASSSTQRVKQKEVLSSCFSNKDSNYLDGNSMMPTNTPSTGVDKKALPKPDKIRLEPEIPKGMNLQAKCIRVRKFLDFSVIPLKNLECYNILHSHLQKCTKEQLTPLELQDTCVVLHKSINEDSSEQWYRGIIKKVLTSDRRVSVYLLDVGAEVTVPASSVRKLPDKLKKYRPFAIRMGCLNLKEDVANAKEVEEYFESLVHQTEVKVRITHQGTLEPYMFGGFVEVKHIGKWFDVGVLLKKFKVADIVSEQDIAAGAKSMYKPFCSIDQQNFQVLNNQ